MAHKPKVTITEDWSDLTAAIQDYSSSSEYNVQVLTTGKIGFCLSPIAPTTQSWTVVQQYEIVVLSALPVGCWVRSLDATTGALSIEEIPNLV